MNKNSRIALLATALFALSGCSTRAVLSIYSEPEGAYIVDPSGRNLGMAPVVVSYDFGERTNLCFEASGYEAHWASGAVAALEPVELCQVGYYDSLIQRDLNQPGLREDMKLAMQLKMARAQEAQARAERAAADAALQAAYAQQEAAQAYRRLARQREQQQRHEREDRREHEQRGEQTNAPAHDDRDGGRDRPSRAPEAERANGRPTEPASPAPVAEQPATPTTGRSGRERPVQPAPGPDRNNGRDGRAQQRDENRSRANAEEPAQANEAD